MNPKDRLIVALDVDSKERAERLVAELGPHVGMFKVGQELFTAAGPDVVRLIARSGCRIFLDLKFHDIPNTVARAVGAASQLGAFFVTLHISGGRAMLEAAASALPAEGTLLLGVTVLTSHTDETLKETGAKGSVADTVRRFAVLARESGLDGVVCSPHEISLVRETVGESLVIVTPGIRPKGAARGDQARVTTAREARRLGCDYIVVGRPITEASSPKAAAQSMVEELSLD
jgi:orotidine-5'-phosphate decarboxylase